MTTNRDLYERIVITDDQGRQFVYYGPVQMGTLGHIKVVRVESSPPQPLSVPLKRFISDVMDKGV